MFAAKCGLFGRGTIRTLIAAALGATLATAGVALATPAATSYDPVLMLRITRDENRIADLERRLYTVCPPGGRLVKDLWVGYDGKISPTYVRCF